LRPIDEEEVNVGALHHTRRAGATPAGVMSDFTNLVLIAAAFFLAGVIKGIVGLGMPIVVVGLLSPVFGLAKTITLLIVPGIVTNVRQALVGGHFWAILRRQRWVLVFTVVGIWLGTGLLASVDTELLQILLGLTLTLYALYALLLPQLPAPGRAEPYLAPAVGLGSGLMCGMVGIWAVPGVVWYALLRMPRDELVQSLGITFVVLSVTLGASLAQRDLLTGNALALSAAAVPAVVIGMMAGERLRRRLPEALFRRLFLVALVLLGLNIALGA
jgi:uncharacterized membrane protein YfcA